MSGTALKETRNPWIFGSLAIAYATGLLLVLPWATLPGYSAPFLIGVYGTTIFAADCCTVIMLMRLYLREGSPHLLVFGAAYVLSALLVIGHALSFPYAFGPARLFGHETTSVILYLCWRVGAASLLLVGMLFGVRSRSVVEPARRARHVAFTMAASVLAGLLVYAAALHWHMAAMQGDRFSPATLAWSWVAVALSAATVAIAFMSRAYRWPIFGWLALVATTMLTDMILSSVAGARYTLGWYVARCSCVVSAYLLLSYLTIEFARELRDRREPAQRFLYFGAVALAVCGVLMRYFLMPWLGSGIPFATMFGVVAIAVWMGGWGPGVVTAGLGFLLAHMFIEEPYGAIAFGSEDLLALVLYSMSCGLIIALGHNMRTARERSRRAEERFRGSQEAAIQGYGMLRAVRNERGEIVDFLVDYVNPRGAELVHRRAEELIGRHMLHVLPGTQSSGLFARLREVVETGAPAEFEMRYHREGIESWFLNLVVRIDDGVGISFFDVTDSKHMESALAEHTSQLERADANKSRFLAVLSHELRNPLAPLRNGLALLRRRLGADASDMLAMMERQLVQMVHLVDDLLDVSRIDRGKIELRRERVDLEAVLTSAIETARPRIDAKAHQLVVQTAQPALQVEGDPVRLAQIVSNLLINAAKFTPPRGRIELGTRAVDSCVEISVRDNGAGIDASELGNVFEMFVQLDANKKYGAGGLGLGLALVRSLVELHHGSVEAHSEGPGRGSEFIVRLPRAEMAEEGAAEAPPLLPHPEADSKRILVVDDNEDAAQSMGELLRAHGHEVKVFSDAHEAWAAAAAQSPQVAFLDLNMPDMDGFELARQIRRTPWGENARLVAVTGMGRESDVAQSSAAGFDSHLTKPADPERVLSLAAKPVERSANALAYRN
jgi:signal transduction histidine kinase/CheY-like chemotaxis protein